MFVKLIFSVLLIFAHKLSVLITEITRSNANINSDSDLQYLCTRWGGRGGGVMLPCKVTNYVDILYMGVWMCLYVPVYVCVCMYVWAHLCTYVCVILIIITFIYNALFQIIGMGCCIKNVYIYILVTVPLKDRSKTPKVSSFTTLTCIFPFLFFDKVLCAHHIKSCHA